MGLLDLPEDILHYILSFLGTVSLATVRLACRALRKSASSGRRFVTIECEGWFSARARASPGVVTVIHAFESLLPSLFRRELGELVWDGEGWRGGLTLGPPGHDSDQQTSRVRLLTELLAGVAGEVEFLSMGPRWRVSDDQQGTVSASQLPSIPQGLLSTMSLLTSLRLRQPLTEATLQELGLLRRLTSLEFALLGDIGYGYVMQQLDNLPALGRLDLGAIPVSEARGREGREGFGPRFMLDGLASGRFANLQELGIALPAEGAQCLHMLNSLTALTSLHVRSCESTGNLMGLASLTGLQMLELEVDLDSRNPRLAAVSTLVPLTALSGLTHLDLLGLDNEEATFWCEGNLTFVPWDLAVLSHLTALHVLRCNVYQTARFVDGDPLPVQLRFLRAARSLEELGLGFCGSFWTLPAESSYAAQRAVASLASLKKVEISIDDLRLVHYIAPLAVFAAAPSIESLWFYDMTYERDGYLLPSPPELHEMVRGCFRQLKGLRTLGQDGASAPPQFIELLSELSSTQLTQLSLRLNSATVPTMEKIAKFRSLQSLHLRSDSASYQFLKPLFGLKELRSVVVDVNKEILREQHGSSVSAMREQAARLKAVILDSCCLVGNMAFVRMYGWGDPYAHVSRYSGGVWEDVTHLQSP